MRTFPPPKYKKNPCVECGGKIHVLEKRSNRICRECSLRKFHATWAKTKEFRIANGLPLRPVRGDQWAADPIGNLAHRTVKLAIQRKILPPASSLMCADCGAQASAYDHRDYNRPMDVQPVCRGCNRRRGSAKPIELPPFAVAYQAELMAGNCSGGKG